MQSAAGNVALVVLAGCSSILGLDAPSIRSDAQLGDAPRFDSANACVADDFNDNTLAAMWAQYSPAPTPKVAEVGQTLQVTVGSSDTGYAGVALLEVDVRNAVVGVEVVRAFEGTNNETFLVIGDRAETNWVALEVYGMTLLSVTNRDGTVETTSTVPYSESVQRFWRIELSEARATYAWSTDRVTWNAMTSDDITFSTAAAMIYIGAGRSPNVPGSSGVAVFDNFVIDTPTCTPPF